MRAEQQLPNRQLNLQDPIYYARSLINDQALVGSCKFQNLSLEDLHKLQRGVIALLLNQAGNRDDSRFINRYLGKIPSVESISNVQQRLQQELENHNKAAKKLKMIVNITQFHIAQKHSQQMFQKKFQFRKWRMKLKCYILLCVALGGLIVLFLFWRSLKNSKINKVFKLFEHLTNIGKQMDPQKSNKLLEMLKPFSNGSHGGFFRIIKKPM